MADEFEDEMTDELKPCAHCGSPASAWQDDYPNGDVGVSVGCSTCPAHMSKVLDWHENSQDAARYTQELTEAWNRRTPTPSTDGGV